MSKLSKLLIIIIAISCSLFSCLKNKHEPPINIANTFEEMQIPPSFMFQTATNSNINIHAIDNENQPIEGVKFCIYKDHPDSGGAAMATGISNSNGVFESKIVLPSNLEFAFVSSEFIGLPSVLKAEIINGEINCTFGDNGSRSNNYRSSNGIQNVQLKNHALKYLGTFKSDGTPNYLEKPDDKISSATLKDINKSLPELYDVPTYHPQYISSTSQTNIEINELADVWLTFVHEGAGYKNTLCYYTYHKDSAPSKVSDIDTLTVAFPNTSYKNSGGGLKSGNKVKLGRFSKNTIIGFALIANGYGKGYVDDGYHIVYSNNKLNPESTATKRYHNVLLTDPGRDLILLGFEDMHRDRGSDDDFNDAVFFVTSNPVVAIETSNMVLISYTEDDKDKDGVPDNYDEYPTDPNKAFNNYYPDNKNYGSLAFEDLWPGKGDYDFNDLVVDYKINEITNGNNKVVEIEADYVLRAVGASNRNGFGFQLDLAPSDIKNVSGINYPQKLSSLGSNNCELKQSKAVIVLFDDAMKQFQPSKNYINTEKNSSSIPYDTIRIKIQLSEPTASINIGYPPYNAFIFVNQERGREVHLPGFKPTDLVDDDYFLTHEDNTDPSNNNYYRTRENFPWAIHIIEPFAYPYERTDIVKAYYNFSKWAQSGGISNSNWYKDEKGFRNSSLIYK